MEVSTVPCCWNHNITPLSSGLCHVKFKENQSFIISGRSGSGKTTFIFNLLMNVNHLFDSNRQHRILYLYKTDQVMFHQMQRIIPNIIFHKGMIELDEILAKYADLENVHLIIVMDDLMRETGDSPDVSDFFTISCHHSGCSIILVTHNLFHQGKYSKTLALNAGYVILFETPAALDQIKLFARQRFGKDDTSMLNAYKTEVVDVPYGYIIVDMTPNVFKGFRIRNSIFPSQISSYFYNGNI